MGNRVSRGSPRVRTPPHSQRPMADGLRPGRSENGRLEPACQRGTDKMHRTCRHQPETGSRCSAFVEIRGEGQRVTDLARRADLAGGRFVFSRPWRLPCGFVPSICQACVPVAICMGLGALGRRLNTMRTAQVCRARWHSREGSASHLDGHDIPCPDTNGHQDDQDQDQPAAHGRNDRRRMAKVPCGPLGGHRPWYGSKGIQLPPAGTSLKKQGLGERPILLLCYGIYIDPK